MCRDISTVMMQYMTSLSVIILDIKKAEKDISLNHLNLVNLKKKASVSYEIMPE